LTLNFVGFIRADPRSSSSSAFYCRLLRRKPIADPYTQLKTDIVHLAIQRYGHTE